jgi:hypothetical protein
MVVYAALAAGCHSSAPPPAEPKYNEAQVNRWLTQSIRDSAINNAIITQSTLFPYHFTPRSDQLNGLGTRDLGVLAEHFREAPGELNVRRGNVPEELYAQRVAKVQEMLVDAGVDPERIQIGDGPVGGEGLSSYEVLLILEKSRETKSFSSQSDMSGQPSFNLGGGSGGGRQ